MTGLLAPALLAAAAVQAPPVFRAEVGVVRVEVLVTRGGSPIGGLAAADFELRDEGIVQELEQIQEEQTPVDAVLVLDASGSVSGGKLDSLRSAAGAFLDGLRSGENGVRNTTPTHATARASARPSASGCTWATKSGAMRPKLRATGAGRPVSIAM